MSKRDDEIRMMLVRAARDLVAQKMNDLSLNDEDRDRLNWRLKEYEITTIGHPVQ